MTCTLYIIFHLNPSRHAAGFLFLANSWVVKTFCSSHAGPSFSWDAFLSVSCSMSPTTLNAAKNSYGLPALWRLCALGQSSATCQPKHRLKAWLQTQTQNLHYLMPSPLRLKTDLVILAGCQGCNNSHYDGLMPSSLPRTARKRTKPRFHPWGDAGDQKPPTAQVT